MSDAGLGEAYSGRYIANGLGAPWTIFPIVYFVTILVSNIVGPSWWRLPSASAWWADLGLLVVFLAIWYFVITRIPDRIRAAAVRRQVGESAIIRSARLDDPAIEWLLDLSRRRLANRLLGPAVLVITKDGVGIWGGRAAEPQPAVEAPWRAMGEVIVERGGIRAGRLAFTTDDRVVPAGFKIANRKMFGFAFESRRACEQLRDEIVGLRGA